MALEGNKIVCHTAEWLEVEVKRDNNIYYQKFHSDDEGAVADDDVKIIGKTKETGTKITYVPDTKVYGNIFIDVESLKEMLKNMSYFSKGLKFKLVVDGEITEFYSENGLIDGINNKNALSKPFSYHYETADCKVELALQWVQKRGEIKGYANSLYVKDGGRFISAFKSSLTRTFNALAHTKFNGDLIRNVLSGFVSVKVRVGQWSNQQKTSLANPEAGTATSAAISECLKEFSIKRQKDFNQVITLLLQVDKAERAADKAREAVLNHSQEMKELRKSKLAFIEKLKDSEELGENSILLCVEGNSAASMVAKARKVDKFGLLSLKGKIINCLSNTEEKYLANEEIKLLLYAMGIDINNYNPKKLRYGKIGICVDGDLDGSHISLLLMAAIYKLCPQFLKENRLCWLRAPLFIETKNNKRYYYYSEREKQEKYRGGTIISAKGLGSMSADEMEEAMFTEENQKLDILEYEPEVDNLLEDLMGEDVLPRKEFIFENIDFSKYMEY